MNLTCEVIGLRERRLVVVTSWEEGVSLMLARMVAVASWEELSCCCWVVETNGLLEQGLVEATLQ